MITVTKSRGSSNAVSFTSGIVEDRLGKTQSILIKMRAEPCPNKQTYLANKKNGSELNVIEYSATYHEKFFMNLATLSERHILQIS